MRLKQKILRAARPAYVAVATALVAAIFFPALEVTVFAGGQVQSRSIQMSDSTVSATGVSYKVTFTPTGGASPANLGGIVVDFCAGSSTPIVGDTTCTYPTGFDLGATPTFSGLSGIGTGGSWVTTNSLQGGAAAGHNQVFVLSNTTAQAPTGSGTPISFTITGVTNTSTLGTFYARVVTFDTAADSATYTAVGNTRAGSFTGQVDYGGFALSTAAVITVTAKVQEQLTFCLYTGINCAAGGTAVTLGNTQGVLSTTGPFVDLNTKYDVQTNAGGNAIVNVKGPTLTSGSNTIAALTTAAGSVPGTSQFGLCTYESAGANLTPNSNYDGTAGGGTSCTANAGLTQSAGTGITGGNGGAHFYFGAAAQGTYGDTISSASAGPSSTGVVAFMGNVSVTQTAGIYTSNLIFIATGTY